MWGQPALIWAALTLALLTLPVVIVTTEEALRAVPRERARRRSRSAPPTGRRSVHVVLPQAMPGILTGAILAVSRGAGEVAPDHVHRRRLLPAVSADRRRPISSWSSATTSSCWRPSRPTSTRTKPLLYGTVLVLLLLTFLLNLTAILLRSRMRARLAGR